MAQAPITRTIVWTGGRWVDQETSVYAANLPPPAEDAAPLQPNTHPFDKSFSVTYEQVQKMIADAFEQRTAKTGMYFIERDALVTVGYVREEAIFRSSEISALGRRLYRLERPWWKRWFSR